jgi:hypothetical protein
MRTIQRCYEMFTRVAASLESPCFTGASGHGKLAVDTLVARRFRHRPQTVQAAVAV